MGEVQHWRYAIAQESDQSSFPSHNLRHQTLEYITDYVQLYTYYTAEYSGVLLKMKVGIRKRALQRV